MICLYLLSVNLCIFWLERYHFFFFDKKRRNKKHTFKSNQTSNIKQESFTSSILVFSLYSHRQTTFQKFFDVPYGFVHFSYICFWNIHLFSSKQYYWHQFTDHLNQSTAKTTHTLHQSQLNKPLFCFN